MTRKRPRNLDRPPRPRWLSHACYWHLYRHDRAKLDQLIATYPKHDDHRPYALVAAEQNRTRA